MKELLKSLLTETIKNRLEKGDVKVIDIGLVSNKVSNEEDII